LWMCAVSGDNQQAVKLLQWRKCGNGGGGDSKQPQSRGTPKRGVVEDRRGRGSASLPGPQNRRGGRRYLRYPGMQSCKNRAVRLDLPDQGLPITAIDIDDTRLI